jgi:predicted DCC family thiol-disulfide oxidoreductase YuxK
MATKVYYNSACPVCDAGIKDQRQRMEACGVKDVEWIDIHTHPEAVEEVGAPLEQVRERLHVKAEDGRLDVGADAFARLWSITPSPDCSTVGIVLRGIGKQECSRSVAQTEWRAVA